MRRVVFRHSEGTILRSPSALRFATETPPNKKLPGGVRDFAFAMPICLGAVAVIWNVDNLIPSYVVFNPELRDKITSLDLHKEGARAGLTSDELRELEASMNSVSQPTGPSRNEALERLSHYRLEPIRDDTGKIIAYQQKSTDNKVV